MSHVKPGIVVYLELTRKSVIEKERPTRAASMAPLGATFNRRNPFLKPGRHDPSLSDLHSEYRKARKSSVPSLSQLGGAHRRSRDVDLEPQSRRSDSVEAEASIIDVEAAESIANLSIDDLLRKWTNVAEVPPSHDGGDDGEDDGEDDDYNDGDGNESNGEDEDTAGLITAVVSN